MQFTIKAQISGKHNVYNKCISNMVEQFHLLTWKTHISQEENEKLTQAAEVISKIKPRVIGLDTQS
jgi:hypothetical protein